MTGVYGYVIIFVINRFGCKKNVLFVECFFHKIRQKQVFWTGMKSEQEELQNTERQKLTYE